jgi:hypothetical protein
MQQKADKDQSVMASSGRWEIEQHQKMPDCSQQQRERELQPAVMNCSQQCLPHATDHTQAA